MLPLKHVIYKNYTGIWGVCVMQIRGTLLDEFELPKILQLQCNYSRVLILSIRCVCVMEVEAGNNSSRYSLNHLRCLKIDLNKRGILCICVMLIIYSSFPHLFRSANYKIIYKENF